MKNTVAAIVPWVSDGGHTISPFTITRHLIRTKPIPAGTFGVPLVNVYAINSAAAFKVEVLKSLGGYDPAFSLDYSDIVMFHRLRRHHFSIFIAGFPGVPTCQVAYEEPAISKPGKCRENYRITGGTLTVPSA